LVAVVSVVLISTGRKQVVTSTEPVVALPNPAVHVVDQGTSAPSQQTSVPAVGGADLAPPAIEAQVSSESRVESLTMPRPQAPARETTAQETSSAGSQFLGTLSVRSDPAGASVRVNGRLVGKTPVQLSRYPAGSYVVWVERQGYRRWTSAVQLSAYQTTRISTTLEAESAP
jgi:hypothetical protein